MLEKAIQIIDEMLPRCRCDYSASREDMQRAYCYRQLNYMRLLAEDAASMIERSGGYSGAILSRSLLEALLRLGAAAESPEMCLRILHTDAQEDLKRSEYFREIYPDPGEKWQEVLDGMSDDVGILKKLAGEPLKKVDLFSSTPVGGLRGLYRSSYHGLSKVAHCNYTIIDLCEKRQTLAGSGLSMIILFICIAGIITSDLFGLEDEHHYGERLRDLHPDLKGNG